jgi:hypothetical protein
MEKAQQFLFPGQLHELQHDAQAGGRWLLKNAVACSGWEKTALKNPSLV